MVSSTLTFEGELLIPAEARSLQGFRHWVHSDRFPEQGRIDYLSGDLEIDMSPEDLYTHGAVKAEIAAELQQLVTRKDLGNVFVDRTRVTAPNVGLSVEPDVVVVLWDSLEAGRAREVPAAGKGPDRFIEIEGAPDLVVEILSDSSARKDRRRLPELYEAAGVRELWLVDARPDELAFEVRSLGPGGYLLQSPQAGWRLSPVLGRKIRLSKQRSRHGRWRYRLESAE